MPSLQDYCGQFVRGRQAVARAEETIRGILADLRDMEMQADHLRRGVDPAHPVVYCREDLLEHRLVEDWEEEVEGDLVGEVSHFLKRRLK